MPPKLLTVNELCELLYCKPITVYRRCNDGSWPSLRAGRNRLFTEEHVAQILKVTEQAAKPAKRPDRPKKAS